MRHWMGNELADALAGFGAATWSLSPAIVKVVGALDEKVEMVQRRLAFVLAEVAALEHRRQSLRPRRR